MSTSTGEQVVSGWGLSARVPTGWEGRLYLRPTPTAGFSSPQTRAAPSARAAGGGLGWAGEVPAPVLHVGNFALPGVRGDFGSGAVDTMGARNAFVALVEFGPQEVGSALFAASPQPRPRLQEFAPGTLQIRRAGQLGYQRFFTLGEHALCLFVVLGSAGSASPLLDEVHHLLDGVEVS